MFYTITRHAMQRLQQRGKTVDGITMLLRYGNKEPGNLRVLHTKEADAEIARRRTWLFRLKKRRPHDRKLQKKLVRRIKALEIMRSCAAVFENGKVITIYNQTPDRRRRRRRFW
ncbi:MAG: hypothetical protein ACNYPH_06345 [Gammaproteobacteria bacterium WSBS_2016_MAG_OTU1]